MYNTKQNNNMTRIILAILVAAAGACVWAQSPAQFVTGKAMGATAERQHRFIPDNPRMHKPTRADGQLFKVHIEFDFKEGEGEPYFSIYNESYFDDAILQEKSCDFEVPAGTYDIFADCYVLSGKSSASVIREGVVIEGDTEIRLKTEEASQYLIVEGYLPDGSKAVTPIVTFDDAGTAVFDRTNATIDYAINQCLLYRKGVGGIMSAVTGNGGREVEEKEKTEYLMSRYMSPVSKNYLLVSLTGITANNNCYFLETSQEGLVNTVMRNDAPFVRYEEDFAHSPLWEATHDQFNHRKCVRAQVWLNKFNHLAVGDFLSTNENCEIWMSADAPKPGLDLHTAIIPALVEYAEVDENGYLGGYWCTYGLPAIPSENGGWEYVNNNHTLCGNYAFQIPADGSDMHEYPGHPAYTYTSDMKGQMYGDSAPISVVMQQKNPIGDNNMAVIVPSYIGRLGEVRSADEYCMVTDFSLNGEPQLSSSKDFSVGWLYGWATNGHEPGKIDIVFRDENVTVDGLQGKNVTEVSYDERNEDWTAPTLQMLMFKDKDGKVTDRFDNAADGMMYFSGGDFQWVYNSSSDCYYTFETASTKVEYAPYGEDTFSPIEVAQVPELYFMPGFGDCYSTNLAEVDRTSKTGWFDLRIEMTDKAGNRQRQTISPAFKVNALSSIESASEDDVKVWTAGREICTAGADGAAVEVYSVSGQKVASTSADRIDASAWPAGVYMVRVSTPSSASTHKVIVR